MPGLCQDKNIVLVIHVSRCSARLKVRDLTLERVEHFQASKHGWQNTRVSIPFPSVGDFNPYTLNSRWRPGRFYLNKHTDL